MADLAPHLSRRLTRLDPQNVLTVAILSFAGGCIAWPLLRAQWLPWVDYPQHLGTIAAIHGQHQAAWSSYFTVDLFRTQYLAFYLLSHWLSYIFDVETATRLVATAGLASLPLAVGIWLRSHGRPAILGALVAPVALNSFAFWGFINYCSAMPLALLALAAHAWLVRRPSAKPAWVFAFLATAVFYMHAQLYAWLAIACAVQTVAMRPSFGWRHALSGLWRALIAAIPSVLAVLYWVKRSAVLQRGMDGGRAGVAQGVAEGQAQFQPVADTLHQWQSHGLDVYRGHEDDHLAILFYFAIFLLIALRGTWQRPPVPPEPEQGLAPELTPTTYGPEAVLACTIALYLFAPNSYKLIAPINDRFLPLALAMLPALGPLAKLPGRVMLAISLIAIGIGIKTAQVHDQAMQQTDQEVGNLGDVLQHALPGKRLLGLIYDRDSAQTFQPTWLHLHQYYQARNGGSASFGFAEFTISPVQYRRGTEPPPFPPRFEWTPERFDYATYKDYFDYYLVRRAPGPAGPDLEAPRRLLEGRQADPSQRVQLGFYRGTLGDAPHLVFENAHWSLWSRATPAALGPAVATPAAAIPVDVPTVASPSTALPAAKP